MARVNRGSLRIDSDFTEEIVGFALESFLSLITFPQLRFSIEPFSRSKERWLGADARLIGENIRGFRPFYMQFKRPSAYPVTSRSRIVVGRKDLHLSTVPRSLFFQLRAKRRTHKNFQHNILFRLQRRLQRLQISAAYVCPLFLKRDAYRFQMHLAGLSRMARFWRNDPWDLEAILVHDGNSEIEFERIQVLAEHVSIPAHIEVQTSNHAYSFNESGVDICFHSPTELPGVNRSLGLFLKEASRGFLKGEGQITKDTASDHLDSLLEAIGVDEGILFDTLSPVSDDPIGKWFIWGDILRREFEIEQYAFVIWKE